MRTTFALLLVALMLAIASGASGVVGGRSISIASAPWTVLIKSGPPDYTLTCTGSIIDASHVVTAADCFMVGGGVFVRPSEVEVEAGLANYNQAGQMASEQVRRDRSYRIAPRYNWQGQSVIDLAVLTLTRPFNLGGPDVRAVALPTADARLPDSGQVVLAGFGFVNEQHPRTGSLREMTTSVAPRGNCNLGVSGFCTADRTASPCDGDNGAGLVTVGQHPTLIGVETFLEPTPANLNWPAHQCAPGGNFAIYDWLGWPEFSRFIHGHGNASPTPYSTRWIPGADWTIWQLTKTDLNYSLPRSWRATKNGVAWDPTTGADLLWTSGRNSVFGVAPSVSTMSAFVASWRPVARRNEQAKYRKASITFRTIHLPGVGETVETISSDVTKAGQHVYSQEYLFRRHGITYDADYNVAASGQEKAATVFTTSARTIHFCLPQNLAC